MKTKRHQHSGLAQVRARLGLTQADMALKLGISISLAKMVEVNQRTLPFKALLKLAQIEIDLAKQTV